MAFLSQLFRQHMCLCSSKFGGFFCLVYIFQIQRVNIENSKIFVDNHYISSVIFYHILAVLLGCVPFVVSNCIKFVEILYADFMSVIKR